MAKKIILTVLSFALVFYLLSQFDARDVFRVVADFPPGYMFGGFALFILGHLVRALRIRVLLGGVVPARGLFRVIALQTAAVGFLPFRAGEFSLMYLLKSEYGVEYARGAAVLVLAKAFDFLIVVSLFLVSSGILPIVPGIYRDILPWAGALFFAVVAALFFMGRSREIYRMLPAFFREGPLADNRFMEMVKKVFEGVEVIRSKKTLAGALGTSLVLWVFLYGSNFLVIKGVGLDLSVMEMVFLVTSMSLFANLPIHSPGGFGTTESFWTIVLVAMGVSKEMSIATGFGSHLVTIAYSLVFMLYGAGLFWKAGAGRAEPGAGGGGES
ncbi:MAG TPA: lysylphosphatidylglycerol synthase transmembrane domain-containing protein [Nitrospirota bacterium]